MELGFNIAWVVVALVLSLGWLRSTPDKSVHRSLFALMLLLMLLFPVISITEALKSTDMLRSWREIADYLNRGTRTVQRWSIHAGLPVHRFGPPRAPVFAFRSEIEACCIPSRPVLAGNEQRTHKSLAMTR